MNHATAKYYVVLSVRTIVKNIGLKKTYINLIMLRKSFSLFNSLGRYIKCGYHIAALCQENRILPFPAAYIQDAVRPYRR